MTPYNTETIRNLLAQLQSPEMAAHRWGQDEPLHGIRGILADAMQEAGMSGHELLREPGRHIIVGPNGEIQPGRFADNHLRRAAQIMSDHLFEMSGRGHDPGRGIYFDTHGNLAGLRAEDFQELPEEIPPGHARIIHVDPYGDQLHFAVNLPYPEVGSHIADVMNQDAEGMVDWENADPAHVEQLDQLEQRLRFANFEETDPDYRPPQQLSRYSTQYGCDPAAYNCLPGQYTELLDRLNGMRGLLEQPVYYEPVDYAAPDPNDAYKRALVNGIMRAVGHSTNQWQHLGGPQLAQDQFMRWPIERLMGWAQDIGAWQQDQPWAQEIPQQQSEIEQDPAGFFPAQQPQPQPQQSRAQQVQAMASDPGLAASFGVTGNAKQKQAELIQILSQMSDDYFNQIVAGLGQQAPAPQPAKPQAGGYLSPGFVDPNPSQVPLAPQPAQTPTWQQYVPQPPRQIQLPSRPKPTLPEWAREEAPAASGKPPAPKEPQFGVDPYDQRPQSSPDDFWKDYDTQQGYSDQGGFIPYGDEEALRQAISLSPWNIGAHQALSDWHQEFGDQNESAFHGKVAEWLPQRLDSLQQVGFDVDGQWLFPDPAVREPFQINTWAPAALPSGIWLDSFRPHARDGAPRWGLHQEEAISSDDVGRIREHLGSVGGEYPPDLRTGAHNGRRLNPEENLYLQGILTEDTDPSYWPVLEQILRERHRRGQRFAEDGQPTSYAQPTNYNDEEGLFRALASRWDDHTGHGVLADYLDDRYPHLQAFTEWLRHSAGLTGTPPEEGYFGALGNGLSNLMGEVGPFRVSAYHPQFSDEDRQIMEALTNPGQNPPPSHDMDMVEMLFHPMVGHGHWAFSNGGPGLENADPRYDSWMKPGTEEATAAWASHGGYAKPVGFRRRMPTAEAQAFLAQLGLGNDDPSGTEPEPNPEQLSRYSQTLYGPDEERQAFLDHIGQNPTDLTARGVFADWLQEQGHPEDSPHLAALRGHQGPVWAFHGPQGVQAGPQLTWDDVRRISASSQHGDWLDFFTTPREGAERANISLQGEPISGPLGNYFTARWDIPASIYAPNLHNVYHIDPETGFISMSDTKGFPAPEEATARARHLAGYPAQRRQVQPHELETEMGRESLSRYAEGDYPGFSYPVNRPKEWGPIDPPAEPIDWSQGYGPILPTPPTAEAIPVRAPAQLVAPPTRGTWGHPTGQWGQPENLRYAAPANSHHVPLAALIRDWWSRRDAVERQRAQGHQGAPGGRKSPIPPPTQRGQQRTGYGGDPAGRENLRANPTSTDMLKIGADWSDDQGNSEEAALRREMAAWLDERLGQTWQPPGLQGFGGDAVFLDKPQETGLGWPAIGQDGYAGMGDTTIREYLMWPRVGGMHATRGELQPENWWWGRTSVPEGSFSGIPESQLNSNFGMLLDDLNPAERAYSGITPIGDVTGEEWEQIIDLMRKRKHELKRFADDGQPTNYGDREAFEQQIASDPLDPITHLVMSDFLDDQGDPDAAFRRAVGQGLQRRHSTPHEVNMPPFSPLISASHGLPTESPPSINTWMPMPGSDYPFISTHSIVNRPDEAPPLWEALRNFVVPRGHTVNEAVGLRPGEDPGRFHHDTWLRSRAEAAGYPFMPWEQLYGMRGLQHPGNPRRVTPAERVVHGIDNIENIDPALWPQIEALLRDYWNRDVTQFSESLEPTSYADPAHWSNLAANPLSTDILQIGSDWARENGDEGEADFRLQAAEWLNERLGKIWTPPETRDLGGGHFFLDQPDDTGLDLGGGHFFLDQPDDTGFIWPSTDPGFSELMPISPRVLMGDEDEDTYGFDRWWWGRHPTGSPIPEGTTPEQLANWRRNFDTMRLKDLTHEERAYAGITPIDKVTGEQWANIVDLMRRRKAELGRFADPDQPTAYDDIDRDAPTRVDRPGAVQKPQSKLPPTFSYPQASRRPLGRRTDDTLAQAISILAQKKQGLPTYADEFQPTPYGTDEELIAAINQNPTELGAHQALADWTQDYDHPDADFRRAVFDSMQRRLQTWEPAQHVDDRNDIGWLKPQQADDPYFARVLENPNWFRNNPTLTPPFNPQLFYPVWARNPGPNRAEDWRWTILDREGITRENIGADFGDFPSRATVGTVDAGIRAHGMDPQAEYIPWWLENEANINWHQPLDDVERWFAGISDPSQIDPALWPQIEAMLRNRHQRGLRLEDDQAPVPYDCADHPPDQRWTWPELQQDWNQASEEHWREAQPMMYGSKFSRPMSSFLQPGQFHKKVKGRLGWHDGSDRVFTMSPIGPVGGKYLWHHLDGQPEAAENDEHLRWMMGPRYTMGGWMNHEWPTGFGESLLQPLSDYEMAWWQNVHNNPEAPMPQDQWDRTGWGALADWIDEQGLQDNWGNPMSQQPRRFFQGMGFGGGIPNWTPPPPQQQPWDPNSETEMGPEKLSRYADYNLGDQRAFEEQIEQNPHDGDIRRIYADWLRERGQDRMADDEHSLGLFTPGVQGMVGPRHLFPTRDDLDDFLTSMMREQGIRRLEGFGIPPEMMSRYADIPPNLQKGVPITQRSRRKINPFPEPRRYAQADYNGYMGETIPWPQYPQQLPPDRPGVTVGNTGEPEVYGLNYGLSERDNFLRAIIANPREATTALAFADYLEENGHADHAAVIRAHVGQFGNSGWSSDMNPTAWAGQDRLHGGPAPSGRGNVELDMYLPVDPNPPELPFDLDTDVPPYNIPHPEGVNWNASFSGDEAAMIAARLLQQGAIPHGGSYWQEGYNGMAGRNTHPEHRIFDQAAAAHNTERLSRYADYAAPLEDINAIASQHLSGGSFDPNNFPDQLLADKLGDYGDPREMIVRRDLGYRGGVGASSFLDALYSHMRELGGVADPQRTFGDHKASLASFVLPDVETEADFDDVYIPIPGGALWGYGHEPDQTTGLPGIYNIYWRHNVPGGKGGYFGDAYYGAAMTRDEVAAMLDHFNIGHRLRSPAPWYPNSETEMGPEKLSRYEDDGMGGGDTGDVFTAEDSIDNPDRDYWRNRTPYGLREDENAFWSAIEAQPLEVSNHEVFADFLRDQGRDQDADYRQAVADSMRRRLSSNWKPPEHDRFGYLHQNPGYGPEDEFREHALRGRPATESYDVSRMWPALLPDNGIIRDPQIVMPGWGPEGLPPADRWSWEESGLLEGMRPLDEVDGRRVDTLPTFGEWQNERWNGFNPGSPPIQVSRWLMPENHPHLLNPAELAFAGITNPADITNEGGLWRQIEELMRDRFDRGQRLEDDQAPVNYGTEEELIAAINNEPREVSAHLGLADWYAEQGMQQQEAMRRAMAESIHRRLNTSWTHPTVRRGELASPTTQGPEHIPELGLWFPDDTNIAFPATDVYAHKRTPWQGNGPQANSPYWYWGYKTMSGDEVSRDRLPGFLGVHPEDVDQFAFPQWSEGRGMAESLLNPGEELFAGLRDINNMTPDQWPQLENEMRWRFRGGQKLSREGS